MEDDLDQTAATSPVAYEPAADAAPSTRVTPPGASPSGSRFRWAIALGVVSLVVVASVFAISLFTGRAANATVLGYVPSDSIMYVEARLDLPGDQRAAVAAFLSKFPGFADQSAIETKVDETLDRLVEGATNGDQTYSSDIKPWFGGEVAYSIGALPDLNAMASGSTGMGGTRALVLVSIKDEAGARAWFDALIASGGTPTTESYGGATLTLVNDEVAFALIDGKVAVVGDVASVRAAVDTKGAGGFESKPELTAALDATSGDHVGFVYFAIKPLLDWSSQAGGSTIPGMDSGAYAALIPDWIGMALRVEDDGVVAETIYPKTEQAIGGETRSSAVVDHVPANAIAVSVTNDYGKTLLQSLDLYRADPSLKSSIDSLDQALATVGGPDKAIGWIGDLAMVVGRTDSGVEAGLIISTTDRAAAESLVGGLRTLLAVGSSSAGVSVRDEPYAGTTITIVELGEMSDLLGLSGMSPQILGTSPTLSGPVEVAFAITDQVVVIGADPGFVRHVLDTTAATSLASNDRYKSLIGRAGQGSGIVFADLTAIREMIEPLLAADPSVLAQYEEEVKPFLVAFDAIVGSSGDQGDLVRSRIIITVK